ncbi:uncharacterized protein LOC143291323 isoform X1 [Babylonia areolata]|uniref:uncharacterized protein LOC143291323 isoform X1 n=1 Tax=Babylonia areolata TaxID=304850 RepID=UPI003FD23165
MSSARQVLALCFVACSLVLVTATQTSERASQNVEVTFYQLSSSEWSNSESSFKTLLAAEAASYCASNAATCGLTSGFLFTSSEVGVASGPTEESKSLKISFYVDFPTVHVVDGSSPTTYVVNSAAVTTMLTNIRSSLEGAVGADITYIGSEFYSIDPDATMNKVLIPIAFIVLLAVIILAIALHVWNKRKEQEQKKKQRALEREKRKKTSRIAPVVTMETETKKASDSWLRSSRKKKAVVKQLSGGAQATNGNATAILSLRTSHITYDATRSTEETRVMAEGQAAHYEDPVPLHTNTLPPLPLSEEESKDQQEEKRKEKKEKRRRKKEKRQRSAKKEGGDEGREESESEFSRTESLEKTLEKNVVPVEDEPSEVVA